MSAACTPPFSPFSYVLTSEDLCWCVQADCEEDLLTEAIAQARDVAIPQGKLLWAEIKKVSYAYPPVVTSYSTGLSGASKKISLLYLCVRSSGVELARRISTNRKLREVVGW